MLIISLFGPDGTGKTTHANLIADFLRERGYKVWRTNLKHHHTFSYLFLKIIVYKSAEGQDINYYGFAGNLRNRIRTPWKILELLSLFIAMIYRVFLPLLLGYILVCDRYIPDTIVALSYFLGETDLSGIFAKILFKTIPKNSVFFHLDANTNVIIQRKRDEPLTKGLIDYYRQAYKIIAVQLREQGFNVATIDTTTATVENVHEIIRKMLYKFLG